MASVGVDRAALPIPDPPSRGPDIFDARTAPDERLRVATARQ
jgi:hypothetical protein